MRNNIESLNQEFSIKNKLQIVEGPSGMPEIEVNTKHASARISLKGGQILSYKPAGSDDDLFYLSDQAIYETGQAIRGGVPVCWPWFGSDPGQIGRQSHGFARNLLWTIKETAEHDDRVVVTLLLKSRATTRQWWPSDFRLQQKVTIGKSLQIKLTTKNKGSYPFTISDALHSYFNIGDIEQTTVLGLNGLEYLDKTLGFSKAEQLGDVVATQELDRIYLNSPDQVQIIDNALHRRINIHHESAKNFVIWNPWDKACSIRDMGDDDYKNFICVETANALDHSVVVQPDESHAIKVTYQVEPTESLN